MRAWTAAYADQQDVVGVSMLMEVETGVLKSVVATTFGTRWDQGRCTIEQAQERPSSGRGGSWAMAFASRVDRARNRALHERSQGASRTPQPAASHCGGLDACAELSSFD
jgi:hypothetical protein